MNFFYALHCPTAVTSKHHYTTLAEAQAEAEKLAAKLRRDVAVMQVVGVAEYSGEVVYSDIPESVM